MHLFESTIYGSIALVGHASIHDVHVPQKSSICFEYSNTQLVIILAIKNQLPYSLLIIFVCLPCQPIPALTLHALSIMGPVSTYEIPSNVLSISLSSSIN